MNITVKDFVDRCLDSYLLKVKLYDVETFVTLYEGFADDIPDKFYDRSVWSFDPPNKECTLTLNL